MVHNQGEAERIAAELFGLIASDSGRLTQFLAETGLAPDDVRAAASEPGFLLAILDHVSADEARLVALAAEAGMRPEDIDAARQRLGPQEGDPFG